MVLLGTNDVDGELFWVLHNSWASLQIIEMSTEYLAQSGAMLNFLKNSHRPRETLPRSVEYCPSPIS
eukprot:scaffold48685_cov46-Attheya_sp.AAC.5